MDMRKVRGWMLLVVGWLIGTGGFSGMVAMAEERPEAAVEEGKEVGSGCDLVAVEGGVACTTIGGREVFRYLHPTLFGDPRGYQDRDEGRRPAGPLRRGEDDYYGVGVELLRFHRGEQRVKERWRLPSTIVELKTAGSGGLEVSVQASRGERQVVRFDPDSPIWTAPWEWSQTMSRLHEVMWLEGVDLRYEPGAGAGLEVNEELEESLVARLEARKLRDESNPYLDLYRGEALERLGKVEEARAAFEEALGNRSLDWIDAFRIAQRRYYHGDEVMGAQAIEVAREKLEEADVVAENITAMINGVFVGPWVGEVVKKARAEEDDEALDAMLEGLFGLLPMLEGRREVGRVLAHHFAAEGASEPAQRWADWASRPSPVEELFMDTARRADFYVVLQFGLLLVLLFSGAVLGLGRKRESGQRMRTRSLWSEVWPRFGVIDCVLLLPVVVGVVFLSSLVAPSLQVMARVADAPGPVMGDAMNAPGAEEWLAFLDGGEAGERLLEHAQAVGVALATEGEVPALESTALMIEAVEYRVEEEGIRKLSQVSISPGVSSEFGWMKVLEVLEISWRGWVGLLIVLGLNLLVFGGLIQAVAQRVEKIDFWGQVFIVGAPRTLSVLRVPALVSFAVGAVALTPLGSGAQEATAVVLRSYFGLGEMAAESMRAPLPGPLLVGLALGLHLIGVALMVTRRSKERRAMVDAENEDKVSLDYS